MAVTQGFNQRIGIHQWPTADIDNHGVVRHGAESRGIEKLAGLFRERRKRHEIIGGRPHALDIGGGEGFIGAFYRIAGAIDRNDARTKALQHAD